MSIEVALTGRLGNPPQYRTTSAGKPWASFSLAVGTGDDREWIQIAVFEPATEELPGDVQKGEQLYVEGNLKLNRWQGADGPRSCLQVVASKIVVLGRIGRRRSLSSSEDAQSTKSRRKRAPATCNRQHDLPDDPIPI